MSIEITEAFVQQYKSNAIQLAQQRGSRLKDCVHVEMVTGDRHNFEKIGPADAVEKVTRHSDTPQIDTPHDRRVVILRDFEWADLVDHQDKIRVLISPESEYAIAGGYAMGREYDKLIIAAAFAAALNGDGSTTTFPVGNIIVAGGTGMTLAKLLEAKEILLASDVDEDHDEFYIAMASKQLHELLNDDKLTSADYNTVKALVAGDINTFLGFTFKRTELLAIDTVATPDERQCMAWTKSGIGLAIGTDVVARMTERDDKSYALQVYLAFTAEAVRIEETKVIQINTDLGVG